MKQRFLGLILFPDELDPSWAELMAASGLNTIGIHPPGGKNAGRNLSIMVNEIMQTTAFKESIRALSRAGISIEYKLHAMEWMLPREEYDDHPNWFRMDESGQRNPDFNLCPSNDDALKRLEKGAEDLARRLPSPDTHRYFFWIDDVRDKHCRCEKCRCLSPSDQALIMYNHILHGVRQADPEATHCYLAYLDSIEAPMVVRPENGLFLEYAPIERCSGYAINDVCCSKNREQASHIDGLLNVFDTETAQVLEYWLDNSRFYNWKRPYGELPFFKAVMQQDIEFYKSKGFTHFTSFACGLGFEYVQHYGIPPIETYGRILNGN